LNIIISVNKNEGKMQMLSLYIKLVIEFNNLRLFEELNKILFGIFYDFMMMVMIIIFQKQFYLFKYGINRL